MGFVQSPRVLLHLTQFQLRSWNSGGVGSSIVRCTKPERNPFQGKTWTYFFEQSSKSGISWQRTVDKCATLVLSVEVLFSKGTSLYQVPGFSCERLSSNLSSFLEQLKLNLHPLRYNWRSDWPGPDRTANQQLFATLSPLNELTRFTHVHWIRQITEDQVSSDKACSDWSRRLFSACILCWQQVSKG